MKRNRVLPRRDVRTDNVIAPGGINITSGCVPAGMVTMEAAVMDLVTRGIVTADEAKKRVPELAHIFDKHAAMAAPARGVAR